MDLKMNGNKNGSEMSHADHGAGAAHTGHGAGHSTTFYANTKLTVFLEVLAVDSVLGIVFVGVVFVIIAMCYEGIRCLRMHLSEKHRSENKKITMTSLPHLIQTGLFLGEITFAYAIMLMVMTYNVWMLVAVVTGSAIGFQLCLLLTGSHKLEGFIAAARIKTCKPLQTCEKKKEEQNGIETTPLKCGKGANGVRDRDQDDKEVQVQNEEVEALVASV